jgi:3-oxoacyl-[acyl-carrier protein] reductase
MRLKDLSILITGSGRGIGKSIALRCADEGAIIAVNDINHSRLEQICASLELKDKKVFPFKADISSRKDAKALIEAVIEAYGRIDVLINNAGITRNKPFLDITEDEWDEVIRVNLKGVFNCAQYAARFMIEQKSGRIINMSSRAYLGASNMANYASSKAGIIGLTRSMAIELGPYGITVNAVAPGTIETELSKKMPADFFRNRIKDTPLRRIGHPEEVADSVVFLASSEANFITGEVLHVTGGFY